MSTTDTAAPPAVPATDVEHHDVLIVGTGFAGLGTAIGLMREGRDDFVVLERADTVGGTWRDNRYPGCGCDVPTPLYSFSFRPNPEWSHLYARQGEIHEYLERVTDEYGVRERIRFGTTVTAMTWEEEAQRWRVRTAAGEELTARVVVGGFGGLSAPKWPEIAGLHDFGGTLLHTAAWDDDLDLAGRRVAVIGTGASAIQLVPEAAKVAARVDVHQRTPAWILPKADVAIGAAPKGLFRRVPALQKALRGAIFGITESLAYPLSRRPRILAAHEALSRRMLRAAVKDPETRRRLTPDYRLGCKRILFSNDWYPAMGRENVDLLTDPIVRVGARGVVTRGEDGTETEREVDVLVCSTGFDPQDVPKSIDVRGRDGVTLRETWAGGMDAHRGTAVAGFPNFAVMVGPNTGTGSTSQVFMIESQIAYVLDALRTMDERRAAVFEVRRPVMDAYNDELQRRSASSVWVTGGCDSWYLDERGRNVTLWPGLASRYRAETRRFRADEFVLEPARAPRAEPERELATA